MFEKVKEKAREIGQDFSSVAESVNSVATLAIIAIVTAVVAFCLSLFAVRTTRKNMIAAALWRKLLYRRRHQHVLQRSLQLHVQLRSELVKLP